jgi:hypothetical protein
MVSELLNFSNLLASLTAQTSSSWSFHNEKLSYFIFSTFHSPHPRYIFVHNKFLSSFFDSDSQTSGEISYFLPACLHAPFEKIFQLYFLISVLPTEFLLRHAAACYTHIIFPHTSDVVSFHQVVYSCGLSEFFAFPSCLSSYRPRHQTLASERAKASTIFPASSLQFKQKEKDDDAREDA